MISETLKKYYAFLKNPNEVRELEKPLLEKIKEFFHLYLINFCFLLPALGIIGLIEYFKIVDPGENLLPDLDSKSNYWQIFLLMVVSAPLIEESIFRAPLLLKNNYLGKLFINVLKETNTIRFYNHLKANRLFYFQTFFYFMTFTFAFLHFGNYEKAAKVWYWAPIFTLGQLVVGFTLGYIRIKFGFWWGVSYHAFHNFIIFSIGLLIFYEAPIPKAVKKVKPKQEISILTNSLNF